VAICRGGRCPIEAVSGQDALDKRSNVAVLLGKLAAAVSKTGEDVWYTGDTSNMAPQVEAAIDSYVDESHTKALAVLPLFEPRGEAEAIGEKADRQPSRVIGALVVEQMVDSRTPDGFLQRVEVVRSHSATALTNALEHEGLFLLPLWRFLGRGTQLFRGRTRYKTMAVVGAIAAVLAVLCFWPIEFTLEGDAQLLPAVRRNVFAKLDKAIVKRVLVDDGQIVAEGQMLVEMESPDLEKERKEVFGQLETVRAEIRGLDHDIHFGNLSPDEESEKSSQRAQLRQRVSSLSAQLELLDKKYADLNVPSPIAGQVVSWQVKRQLERRPVSSQQILMEVVDPSGDWELEVYLPESRIGHVQRELSKATAEGRDLDVTFFLTLDVNQTFQGKLKEVALSAHADSERGNIVRLKVDFDQATFRQAIENPKVGAGAVAKVHCGKAPIGYVYLHDLIDFVRAKILFRL
jgi:multidrug efflux pump subunit AcrA (membrane-fusion protein)